MNGQCYRVVFNESLGAWVAVDETVMARGKRSRGRGRAAAAAVSLFAVMALSEAQAIPPVRPPLPVASTLAGRVVTNTGNITLSNPSAAQLNITQKGQTGIINWDSFNIDKGYKVQFIQDSASSRTLNRIWDASPSQINGQLSANGQVYLINRNGILFGADGQVNVGGLVASALNIKTDDFLKGYLNIKSNGITAAPAFYYAGKMEKNAKGDWEVTDFDVDATGTLPTLENASMPTVSNAGSIKPFDDVSTGSNIMLFAPVVENTGRIETTAGQVVLAAGAKVYLTQSSNPVLRGVLVEVDPFAGGDATSSSVSNTGLKAAMKGIIANRGNITLAAMAVNNNGLLQASTGKTENGSVYLQGRYQAGVYSQSSSGNSMTYAQKGGTVELGADSRIETPVETISEAEVVARAAGLFVADPVDSASVQQSKLAALQDKIRQGYSLAGSDKDSATGAWFFKPSEVRVDGAQVVLRSGSAITAPGATVSIKAASNRDMSKLTGLPPDTYDEIAQTNYFSAASGTDARVVVEQGAQVDVSGYRNVAVDGARNQIELPLTSNELKDAPLQRNGVLLRKTIDFNLLDAPSGVLAVADASGARNSMRYGLQEVAATGGNVNILSTGDVVVGNGSTIDVSGGSLDYSAATLKTTQLAKGSHRVDITQASADVVWDGMSTVTRKVAAYSQGMNAGSITVAARGATVLDGTLKGETHAGAYQTSPSTAPKRGSLTVGDGDGASDANGQKVWAALHIGSSGSGLDASFWNDSLKAVVTTPGYNRIAASTLLAGGFGSYTFNAGDISIDAGSPLQLADGASFTLKSGSATGQTSSISIDSDIRAAGLKFSATAASNIALASGVSIDASGRWINDAQAALRRVSADAGLRQIDGGTVTLQTDNAVGSDGITLGKGSRIDVSGGGYLSASGSFSPGKAGAISLVNLRDISGATLTGRALASGTKAGAGGSLSITAPALTVGDTAGVEHSGFFLETGALRGYAANGFASFNLSASNNTLSISAGSDLTLRRTVRQILANAVTDTSLAGLGPVSVLPGWMKDPLAFTLNATQPTSGIVNVGQGSLIDVGVGGSIQLNAGRQLNLAGALAARAGTVNLTLINPADLSETEPGYFADQGIFLSNDASIDVTGAALVATDRYGRRSGDALAGGSVALTAKKGYIVAQQGAQLKLDGSAASVDNLNTGAEQQLVSDAGSLSLISPEGIVFAAQVSAHGGGVGAAGGNFSLALRTGSTFGASSGVAPTLEIANAPFALESSRGLALQAAHSGQDFESLSARSAWVDASGLATQGFDNVSLQSVGRVHFSGDVNLVAVRQLTLGGRVLDLADADVHLSSNAVQLGWAASGDTESRDLVLDYGKVSGGNGSLRVDAGQIDIVGSTAIRGARQTTLSSSGDLRLKGVTSYAGSTKTGKIEGSLAVAGNLELDAAQIYPDTQTEFVIGVAPGTAQNPASNLLIQGTGATLQMPYSAAGKLSLEADVITQAGVVRAPFGTIELNARQRLDLAAGSLTSASGEGALIPYGTLLTGSGWLDANGKPMSTVPQPTVALRAPEVRQQAGAKVDVSGGGDLYAAEFVPGTGGSAEVLDQPNTWAIIPGYASSFAPSDLASYNPDVQKSAAASFQLTPGTQITLGAEAGVPAGTYTLLPARYALLPGAYKVTLVGGYQDAASALQIRQALGGSIVSGRLSVANTAITASHSVGVLVESGVLTRQRSQHNEALASTWFDAKAASADAGSAPSHLVTDGGHLIIAATDLIKLEGENALQAAQKAGDAQRRGGMLDIGLLKTSFDANGKPTGDIVVGNSTQDDSSNIKTLHVQANDIAVLDADSVLIGGERSQTATGMNISSTAQNLRYNAAGFEHKGRQPGEIIFVAAQHLSVEEGAVIEAAAADPLRPASLQSKVTGDGALLRVAADDIPVIRTGSLGVQGALSVGDKARLAGASVQTDGRVATSISGGATIAAGTYNLGTNKLTLGGAGVSTPANTVINQASLAAMATGAKAFTLRSYDGIDIAGPLSLGQDGSLQGLTLDTASLAWRADSAGSVTLAAQNLNLVNTTGGSAPVAQSGNGTLTLVANGSAAGSGVLNLQGGEQSLQGFGHLDLVASNGVVFAGKGSTRVAGDIQLAAPMITAASSANQTLHADGKLSLPAVTSANPLAAQAGGSLTLEGASIEHAGRIANQSGAVTLHATSGDVTLVAGALIDVSSLQTKFNDTTQSHDAGSITLNADAGSVKLDAGSVLDLRGKGAASAGTLTISASKGEILLNGALQASISAEGKAANSLANPVRTGSVSLDASRLASLDELVGKLADFEERQKIDARTGDLLLSQGKTLKAHNIELDADAGSIRIDGKLDASGESGGNIALAARQAGGVGGGITLGSTALLDAHATGAGQTGGTVSLRVSQDDASQTLAGIAFENGSQINVSGGAGGAGGKLTIDAPRVVNAGDYTLRDGSATTSTSNGSVFGTDGWQNLTTVGAGVADYVETLDSTLPVTYSYKSGSTVYTVPAGKVGTVQNGTIIMVTPTNNSAGSGASISLKGVTNLIKQGRLGNDPVGAGDMQANASYKLKYQAGASAASSVWILLNAETPTKAAASVSVVTLGGGARVNGSLNAFTATAGEVVMFTPQQADFGTTSSNKARGGVMVSATGLSSLAKLLNADGSAIAVGGLVAGKSYVARYNGNGSFSLIDTSNGLIHLSSSANGASLAPQTMLSFTATDALASSAGTGVKLMLNNDAALDLRDAQGDVLTAGFLKSGVSYEVSKINGYYALRPANPTDQNSYPAEGTVANIAVTTKAATGDQTVAFKLDSLPDAGGKTVNRVNLSVNGRGARLFANDGSVFDFSALQNGIDYLAVKQADGSYRLTSAESSLPVSNNGLILSGAAAVILNATKSYSASLVDARQQATMAFDAKQFMTWQEAILGRLNLAGGLPATLQAGIEVLSSGDIKVQNAWDFSTQNADGSYRWRYGSGNAQAGSLSLRAAGTLTLANSISDGFLSDAQPDSFEQGWSFNLVGGADLYAASASQTTGHSGALVLTNRIRTGTGDIRLAAAGDIDLSASGASVYSAGKRIPTSTSAKGDMALPNSASAFLTSGGGDLSVIAGGDIIGRANNSSPTTWLWRTGTGKASPSQAAAWVVKFDQFDQQFGALGGGDVNVIAGGSLLDVGVALPTQGLFGFDGSSATRVTTLNAGNLDVRAAGDIAGGQFLIERGTAQIRAGGAMRADSSGTAASLYGADSQIHVSTTGDLILADVNDASQLLQSTKNTNTGSTAAPEIARTWNSYTANSSLDLRTVAGDVKLIGNKIDGKSSVLNLPATVSMVASGGGIDSGAGGNLYADSKGQLALYAEAEIGGTGFSMPELLAGQYATPLYSDLFTVATDDNAQNVIDRAALFPVLGLLHAGDTQPVVITSNAGDISGIYSFAKPVEISAGRDIRNLSLSVQNNAASDVSRLSAGRDIVYDTLANGVLWHSKIKDQKEQYVPNTSPNSNPAINVYGPGLLEVSAGRNIELANAGGIVSKGPGSNAYLDKTGASISVRAGDPVGLDAAAFAATYLSGAEATNFLSLATAAQIKLAQDVLRKSFTTAYLGTLDINTGLWTFDKAYGAAWQAFAAFYGVPENPAATDRVVLDRFRYQVMWAELGASGKDADKRLKEAKADPGKYSAADLTPEKLYARGFSALNLSGLGDVFRFNSSVSLLKSQIRSQWGGNVDVMVPGGSLNIGGMQAPNANDIDASRLGVVANQGYSSIFVRDAVNVNASRWFAIDGGSILGWASYGNIDAGKGKRTAVSSASQRIDVDLSAGTFKLVDGGAGAGSGIASIFNRPISQGGDVDLYAVRGVVDAGEAGIRSAGNISLSANVVGADFIMAVGSGAPAAAPTLGAVSLSAPAADNQDAKKATEAPANSSGKSGAASNSVLTVEVTPGADPNALAPTGAGTPAECTESGHCKSAPAKPAGR